MAPYCGGCRERHAALALTREEVRNDVAVMTLARMVKEKIKNFDPENPCCPTCEWNYEALKAFEQKYGEVELG